MSRHVEPIYVVPIGGKWHRFSDNEFEEKAKELSFSEEELDLYVSEFQKNRFAFFLPHGRQRRYTQGNDGRALINDTVHDLLLLICPNQVGKTTHGTAYVINRVIPCDPDWVCFVHHGLEFIPWSGPKIVIAASYTWDNVITLWEEYQKFLPRYELGKYAPNYGLFEGENGTPSVLSFGDGKPKSVTLRCGTKIIFLCYSQSQAHWEGKKCDIAHLDEQCPEEKFDGLTFRMATRGAFTPIIMTLTGHVIDGRPDTGAGGWIKKRLVDGNSTKGRKIDQYFIGIKDVPEEIMSKEKKKQLFIQYVEEPQKLNDEKRMREAEARWFGGWEVGGGLVVSPYSPDIHIIDPFLVMRYKPTLYRMVDHGHNPCAAMLIAVMPWGDAVAFAEYYEYGNSINKNCKKIVELSGNERELVRQVSEEDQTWPVFEEITSSMDFYGSEMDGKSFATPSKESYRTIGMVYNDCGLRVTPSTTGYAHNKYGGGLVSILCEWFELDPSRKHINTKIGKKEPEISRKCGAPRFYIFNTLANTRKEIESWVNDPKTGRPVDKDDHLMSCIKFFTARDRPYLGDWNSKCDNVKQTGVSSITGY